MEIVRPLVRPSSAPARVAVAAVVVAVTRRIPTTPTIRTTLLPYWGAGFGFGLGYLYYDPFYSGYYGSGYDDLFGFGGGGGGGGGGYAVSDQSRYEENGSLRLKINPKQAQIFIDGAYVGVVDNFDGAFQKLSLQGGGHKVELKADGYQPLQFEVLITPSETSTYKGEMKRVQ